MIACVHLKSRGEEGWRVGCWGEKPQCGNGQPAVSSRPGRLPQSSHAGLQGRVPALPRVLCWYVCAGIHVSMGMFVYVEVRG